MEDDESLLTPQQRIFIAEWRKKRVEGFNQHQKPPEKKPEKREEKPSWLARKVPPGIQKKFREMVGIILYDPRRHRKT